MKVPFLDLAAATAELRPALDAAWTRVVDRGQYLLGPELEAFEAAWASYLDVPHAIGVGNGLDALVLSLQALGIGTGDEVLVPADTFIASWLAISQLGARPVPVEPEPGHWTLDPDRLAGALTARTRAIMPVHLYGQPADLDPILAFARAHGLAVVEDAAQAHGARYHGQRIGGHGDLVAWSFYPGKNLGAFGDGGAITTRDAALAERLRALRNYGSRVKYWHEQEGRNTRLDELQAAVLAAKLPLLDDWNRRRSAIANRYLAELEGVPGLALPRLRPDGEPVWHLFVVDLPQRDAVQRRLLEAGVETLIHYPVPPHRSGAYADRGPWPALPITERAAATHLSLPMGPHLRPDQQAWVIEQLRAALAAP